MCCECHMIPCHPRCPNAKPQPLVCDKCGKTIPDGAEVFESRFGDVVCRSCLEDMDFDKLLSTLGVELELAG